jgi:hypothetical protein
VNRVQKVLEGANIKLASMASDVLGVSGRAMLEARESGMYQKGSFLRQFGKYHSGHYRKSHLLLVDFYQVSQSHGFFPPNFTESLNRVCCNTEDRGSLQSN